MADKAKGVNWHVRTIFLIALGVFLTGMNRIHVPSVDGTIRAIIARTIFETGQLWPIQYQGDVFIDHPPLYVWLTALGYKLFGVTDFAANIVPRLFAFLTVIVTAMVALEIGYGTGVALFAVIILVGTREFVLGSVRGYIEPLLSFFFYLALWMSIKQARVRFAWPALVAGICVWLGAFAKGPVALWPLLFLGLLIARQGKTWSRRIEYVSAYIGAFAICTAIWAAWNDANGHWIYWKRYLDEQILASALEGRGGSQGFDPGFYLNILTRWYLPWNIFLVVSFLRLIREAFRKKTNETESKERAAYYPFVFLIFGLGFVAGFSFVKWKFGYYIAPAYPAFSLFIAASFRGSIATLLSWRPIAKLFHTVAVLWLLIAAVFPIPLAHDRVPEITAFRSTVLNSPVQGPVWFVRSTRDHNMIGTSGEWYFNRPVIRVQSAQEPEWVAKKLRAPAWIMMGAKEWSECREQWCRQSRLIQSVNQTALIYFDGR